MLQQIQAEFANLCNQVVVADHKTIGEREVLQEIVKKASGYVSIGLELMIKEKKVDPARAAALITRYTLQDIFRVGFGRALELKWRAEKWLKKSWFNSKGFWLKSQFFMIIMKPACYTVNLRPLKISEKPK